MFENKLFEIEAQISKMQGNKSSYGLAAGYGGVVLFYFYLYKYTQRVQYHQKAMNLLEEILDEIANVGKLGFCDGISGIAWLVQLCIEEGFLEDDSDDLLQDIDADIIDWTFSTLESHNLDFFYGSTGPLFYLIKRIPRHTGIIKILNEYISKLDLTARKNDDGLYFPSWDFDHWTSYPRSFNLGIPHGNSSILYVLHKLTQVLVNPTAQILLKDALRLLQKEFPHPMANGYFFPQSFNLTNHKKEGQSRLAWCNGDLGISVVLLKIGAAGQDKDLFNWAEKIANHTLNLSEDNHFVRDSSLCHGAAGCGYMYLKIYEITGNIQLHQEAIRWYDKALKNYKIQEGDYGLMEGLSGLGLAILGLLDKNLRSWDQFLLLD